MSDFQGEMVLREESKQIEQPESEYSNKIKDRIEKYEKIVSMLHKLTYDLKIFGKLSDSSKVQPKIAIAYIEFYKNCIGELRNGNFVEGKDNCEPSLDYFLKECKPEEYKKLNELPKEIENLKIQAAQCRDAGKKSSILKK